MILPVEATGCWEVERTKAVRRHRLGGDASFALRLVPREWLLLLPHVGEERSSV